MKERVFVTGGAGFIGSHIVESLLKVGYDVTVYDNFSSGRIENLSDIRDDIQIIKADILDYDRLFRSMKEHSIVSHQAAQLEIFRCIDNPSEDLEINARGTLNVLRAAVGNDVKKLINASSACVYGQARYIPQDEAHPTNPNWPYGISKLAAEKYCRIYQDYYNLPIVILRYSITYGEREWLGRVLTMFIKRVLGNEPPVVFGEGVQTRDFLYVGDLVRMHNLCIENDDANGEIFNVASGTGTKIKDLAKLVIECSQRNLELLYEDPKEGEFSRYIPGRKRIPAELKDMVLNVGKARKKLGWQPEVSLKEGIIKELEWASRNLDAWGIEDIVHV